MGLFGAQLGRPVSCDNAAVDCVVYRESSFAAIRQLIEVRDEIVESASCPLNQRLVGVPREVLVVGQPRAEQRLGGDLGDEPHLHPESHYCGTCDFSKFRAAMPASAHWIITRLVPRPHFSMSPAR
jgi:hypothetical protein